MRGSACGHVVLHSYYDRSSLPRRILMTEAVSGDNLAGSKQLNRDDVFDVAHDIECLACGKTCMMANDTAV